MGLTTAAIGLVPTYASIGVLSPVLLVVLRFLQGVALGGEWAGAVLISVEHGDQRTRGRNASWTQIGPAVGVLYTLAGIVGGGFAPLIIASLFRLYRTTTAICAYVVGALVVTCLALLVARETADAVLED